MNIVEFLLARIAEDEEVARDAEAAGIDTVPHEHMVRWDPARVLAECQAKRAIVALDICNACDVELQECDHQEGALRAMAAVYANRPDYREEWRP